MVSSGQIDKPERAVVHGNDDSFGVRAVTAMHRQEYLLGGLMHHHIVDRDVGSFDAQQRRDFDVQIVEDGAAFNGGILFCPKDSARVGNPELAVTDD